ncbi:MAG: LicD family protein [Lachnospiraceae bacterium]|nr:LicD family protein [Lachnospiraceae bacterium]
MKSDTYERLSLEEIKRIQFDILKETAGFCDENNLRYYLTGGTLLGAVRHKGFIPWDDDVDIQMPRPDFERMKKIFSEGACGRYSLVTFENSPSHARMFARMVDRDIIYDNRFFEKKYISNMGIDIFPMDGAPPEGPEREEYFKKAKYIQNHFLWSQAKAFTGANPIRAVAKTFAMIPAKLVGRDKYYRQMTELVRQYPYESSNEVGILTAVYMEKEILKKEAYEDTCEVEFEGSMFHATAEWDRYLTNLYGDYMSLPPEKERKRKHGYEAYKIK